MVGCVNKWVAFGELDKDVPSKEYIQKCMSSCILGVKHESGLYLYYIELYIIIIPLGIYIE